MLDIQEICAEPAALRAGIARRGADPAAIDEIVRLAQCRKHMQQVLDQKRMQRNGLTQQINATHDPQQRTALREQATVCSADIKQDETTLGRCTAELMDALLTLPNIPHESVPAGGTQFNREIRRWREPVVPAVARPHWEIGGPLGLDIERGVRLAGSRFYVLKGQLARLEMGLIQMMLDMHMQRHGYELILPPHLVNQQTMLGCGQLPKFQHELYRTQDELYLVPTAESPLAALHRDELLAPEELPKRYVSYTACFRREAGAAGRDTRGILRVHQFNKVELFKFTTPEHSYRELDALVNDAEAVLQMLELPYRVMLLAAGDMGFAAAKTYDLEVWLPGQRCYREISSCSNVEAFQARRTNTRYRPAAQAKPRHVHMLNGSGLAIGRTLIAILENYQQPDGTVVVPAAVQPYLSGLKMLSPGLPQPRGTLEPAC